MGVPESVPVRAYQCPCRGVSRSRLFLYWTGGVAKSTHDKSIFQHNGQLAEMNSTTTKTIFIFYAVVFVSGLLLAIPGIVLGNKEKVVVYNGNADLILTFIAMPIIAISLFDLSFDNGFSLAMKVLAAVLIILSLIMSFSANKSISKTIVVFPTKYVLAGLIALCALIAGQGLIDGFKAQRKKDYEEATAKYLTAAIGAFGAYHLHKLIAKFVKRSPRQA
jgi:hypothetical protein